MRKDKLICYNYSLPEGYIIRKEFLGEVLNLKEHKSNFNLELDMFKKIYIFSAKLILILLFFALVLAIGLLGLKFTIPEYLYFFLYSILSLLILPTFIKFYSAEWSLYKKVGIHSLIFPSLLVLLQTSTFLLNYSRGLDRYSYHLGHSFGPFRVFTQNETFQALYKRFLNIFPYSTQYIVYIAEDATRVFEIRRDLSSIEFQNQFCLKMSRYECFKQILIQTNSQAAFNSTGSVLMIAVGATVVFDEKNKHEKGNIRISTEAQIQIMEISKLIFTALNHESRIENILPFFPREEIRNIPKEVLIELNKIDVKNDNLADIFMGHKFSNDIKNKFAINESVMEAYFTKKTDDEIIGKFNSSMNKKLNSFRERVIKDLDDQENSKILSKEEIVSYKKRIELLNWAPSR